MLLDHHDELPLRPLPAAAVYLANRPYDLAEQQRKQSLRASVVWRMSTMTEDQLRELDAKASAIEARA